MWNKHIEGCFWGNQQHFPAPGSTRLCPCIRGPSVTRCHGLRGPCRPSGLRARAGVGSRGGRWSESIYFFGHPLSCLLGFYTRGLRSKYPHKKEVITKNLCSVEMLLGSGDGKVNGGWTSQLGLWKPWDGCGGSQGPQELGQCGGRGDTKGQAGSNRGENRGPFLASPRPTLRVCPCFWDPQASWMTGRRGEGDVRLQEDTVSSCILTNALRTQGESQGLLDISVAPSSMHPPPQAELAQASRAGGGLPSLSPASSELLAALGVPSPSSELPSLPHPFLSLLGGLRLEGGASPVGRNVGRRRGFWKQKHPECVPRGRCWRGREVGSDVGGQETGRGGATAGGWTQGGGAE